MAALISGRLAGRVALISGGARGQGAAHAERLASEGAVVVIGDVLDDLGADTQDRLVGEGYDVTYVHLDVADPASWEQVRDVVDARFGRLDILVNNAGVIHLAEIADETLEAWNRLLAINLTGAFLGLRTMIPLLRRSSCAAVVNTSSIFGPSGAVGNAAYAASKSGLLGLRPGVRAGGRRMCCGWLGQGGTCRVMAGGICAGPRCLRASLLRCLASAKAP